MASVNKTSLPRGNSQSCNPVCRSLHPIKTGSACSLGLPLASNFSDYRQRLIQRGLTCLFHQIRVIDDDEFSKNKIKCPHFACSVQEAKVRRRHCRGRQGHTYWQIACLAKTGGKWCVPAHLSSAPCIQQASTSGCLAHTQVRVTLLEDQYCLVKMVTCGEIQRDLNVVCREFQCSEQVQRENNRVCKRLEPGSLCRSLVDTKNPAAYQHNWRHVQTTVCV